MAIIKNKVITFILRWKHHNEYKPIDNATEVILPEFEYMADTIKGSGIMGEIEWPSPFNILSAKFSFNGRVDAQYTNLMLAHNVQEFEVSWCVDVYNTADVKIGVDYHKAIIKGMSRKLNPGKIEAGASMDSSNEFEVIYYRKIINGVETLEFDKFNGILKVEGINYFEPILEFLGRV